MRLHQLLALESNVKSKTEKGVTAIYHAWQKPTLFTGLSRTYRSKNEEGETFPAENTAVQLQVRNNIDEAFTLLGDLFNITAQRDFANASPAAKANVVVGENILIKDAPVPFLLFLEKQLVNLRTLFSKAPTLDPGGVWSFDANSGNYVNAPVETFRTKKEPRVIVRSPATDKHPAQTDVIYEDVVVGYWKAISYSGAIPATEVVRFLARVEALLAAVKIAREEANSAEAPPVKVADAIFAYLKS